MKLKISKIIGRFGANKKQQGSKILQHNKQVNGDSLVEATSSSTVVGDLDRTSATEVKGESEELLLSPAIKMIMDKTAHLTDTLATHALYTKITSVAQLRTFMESHVFAVLNFMWLLKALQVELTCVQEVWTPKPRVNPNLTRFINEIVLDEESDVSQDGSSHSSHYELYLNAMEQVQANTAPVKKLVALLQQPGVKPLQALESCRDVIPPPAYEHTRANLALLQNAPRGPTRTARIAAAFTFGREDAIPTMFLGILKGLKKTLLLQENNDAQLKQFDGFTYYLERHIELDGDDHGPLALRMVEEVCGNSRDLWKHAETAALEALEERHQLWDGVVEEINKQKSSN